MKTIRILIRSLIFFAVMTMLTGIVYPLLVTGFAQAVFPAQANGSLIKDGDKIRGSTLLAQDFTQARFFHARPSAGTFATVPSGASNLSPAGKQLAVAVEARREAWRKENGDTPAPSEMLYASGSGLDPDISVDAALAQVNRVAVARAFDAGQKAALANFIKNNPEARELYPAPARINVNLLNLALETDPRFKVQ
jgi:K+-transporting ATPase ATPase C chain